MKNRFAFVVSFCLGLSPLPSKGAVTPSAPEVVRGTESLSIRSIAQDSKKQIWFGTDKNLYCYDGYEPVLCLDRDGNNDHFQVNDLFCLDDKVLLGCVNGLVIYDTLQGTFLSLDPLVGIEVFDLCGEGQTVWVGSRAGLFRYDIPTGELSEVALDKVLNIRTICIEGNTMALGTYLPAEVRIYDLDGWRLKATFGREDFRVPPGSIDAIVAYGQDRFLVGSSSALFEVGVPDRSVRLVSPFAWVKTLCEDNGRYLVGTDNGMYSCWPDRGGEPVMSLDNVVWRIIRDAQGNLWFGSDTGLMLYREKRLIQTLDVTSVATNNLYSSICSDSHGHVFAGGSYGLLLFDGSQDGGDEPVWYRMRDPQHPFPHNKIRRIKENPYTGDVWFETAAGIVKYSERDKAFVPLSDMRRSNVFDLLFEGDRYWIASFSGLACIKDDRIVDEVSMADGLSNNLVLQVAKDTLGRIWIRTEDQNIFLYNSQSLSLEQFRLDGPRSDTGWNNLMEDSDGNIWLASGNRIYKVEPAKSLTSPVRSYDLHGRQTSEVSVLIEVENSVWAAYANNLFILDKESGGIHAITTDVAYSGMYYDKRSGRVYLGALDRIDVIDPGDAFEQMGQRGPGLYITRISVNNIETIPPARYADGVLTLPYNHNNIDLYFSDFSYGNVVHYLFNLDGKEGWFEADGNHIFLPDLSPGGYRLNISGAHEEDARRILTIRIRRPWYASIVALLVYALLAGWLLYMSIRHIYTRKKLKLERLQKAREIAQAKSKIDFFADVSHEFKSPLSMIIAPVSMLLNDSTDDKERKALQMIHDNAMKINSLVRMSLDYYNDRASQSEDIVKTPLELVGFAKQIFQAFEDNFPKLDFNFHSDEDKMLLDLDVIKMEAILTNIISNACKYTPDGGSVVLSLSQDQKKGLLSLRISDTGVGIPEDEFAFIFQRYYQSSRTKGSKQGTGLGLTIVKKYVDILGGDISVTSEESGTTFRILLPVGRAEENTALPHSVQRVSNRRQTIVIVDDNTNICDFLTGMLQDKYHCMCAHNGQKGIMLCKDILPDLIIADVMMPGMNGLEMCRQIREIPILSIVPIILLTAKDDKETERQSIDLNIDAFIGKPFDVETLCARIDQLIDKNRHVMDQMRIEMISSPSEPNSMSPDEIILEKVTLIIEENINDSGFSVYRLCEISGYNEKFLYRKIKSLTNLSTVEYIRSIRMKKAALLLQNGNFTVSETRYMVGFTNSSYFSKAFTSQFGMTPREYRQAYRSTEGC